MEGGGGGAMVGDNPPEIEFGGDARTLFADPTSKCHLTRVGSVENRDACGRLHCRLQSKMTGPWVLEAPLFHVAVQVQRLKSLIQMAKAEAVLGYC